MNEGYEVPSHVMKEWRKHCNCCPDCHQDIPCGGIMVGGMCDRMCNCGEDEDFEADGFDENDHSF